MYPLKINEKYDQTKLSSLGNRFSTTYLGTYVSGDFRENVGSHCGVDIRPTKPNQEVMSVLKGKVVKSDNQGAYGNYIVIEHTGVLSFDKTKTTTLYSCYLHLQTLGVKVGDIVSEGQVIGTTGNTGNSYGEHLHFQIDTMEAPFHPYWPFTGAESKAAGLSFLDSVNKGLGLENGKKFTINPLVYLDMIGGTNKEMNTPPIVKEIHLATPEKGVVQNTNTTTSSSSSGKETLIPIKQEPPKVVTSGVGVPSPTPVTVPEKKEEKITLKTSNDSGVVKDPSLEFLKSMM